MAVFTDLYRKKQQIKPEIASHTRVEERLSHKMEELIRSNRKLEQIASLASYDLQEPLQSMTSYVQLLVRRYKSKRYADADDIIAFAVDGVIRMHNLSEINESGGINFLFYNS